MRRQFDLLTEDQGFLENLGLPWEALNENSMLWILVHQYPLPKGYEQLTVSLAVHVAFGYPRTQLDMVYFNPHICRLDKKPIGALALQNIDNKIWQRWSRHRSALNPWRDGVDNLSTHFALIEYWLQREFIIKPYAISA
ncbi:E2/UBC family protein [Fulvivirgaceae bacterium BMA10]|uniref:E2/UBC family protein n=1 Tax=Splendidivirga corallicola TaxID=3051826 RepID=A0ABT8KT74_9BACT|nr:E2/UBC family protein [Fulvivirgaceae bacterium BMA10]